MTREFSGDQRKGRLLGPEFGSDGKTEKLEKLSKNFQDAKETMDTLYSAMVSGDIKYGKEFPEFQLPFDLDFSYTPEHWIPRGELNVDLKRDEKRIGKCIIKLFGDQPSFGYVTEEECSYGIKFNHHTEECKDKLSLGFLRWTEDLILKGEDISIGKRLNALLAVSARPKSPDENSESSRVYGFYKGYSIEDGINETLRSSLLSLDEVGSDMKGYFKLKDVSYGEINSAIMNSVNLPINADWGRLILNFDDPFRHSK